MASSKVMASSTSRKSDLSRRSSTGSSSTKPASVSDRNNSSSRLSSSSKMTVDGILRNVYSTTPTTETTLVDASITLIDTPTTVPNANTEAGQEPNVDFVDNNEGNVAKTVDDMWREMVSGVRRDVTMKEEAPDEMITLEEFLARNEGVDDDDADAKVQPERLSGGVYTFDPVTPNAFQLLDKVEGSIVGLGNGEEVIGGTVGGRGKRGRGVTMEPLDKAAQQRQRRMIKNRESAARSRERKQAYQIELESLALRLGEENEQLLKEKVERTKERFKQLMEKVVPVVEQRRPPRRLSRNNSF
ncbi:hypothetical protein SLEP1_g4646 [Rubroshorea leprosula]|uniref:BZIP domain-containing protein n=1 Tax=Rubroshorea leprosula TaxID=152421 RepID=A0AAV5HXG9_9ROSI|nr:hypothetical protein SLEP1_g4646 [Rubroshorea leprosula]